MNEEEVYELLERVRVYYQHMTRSDALIDEWFKGLKNYSAKDVNSGFDKYLKDERNRNRIPMPQDLISGLSTIDEQKANNNNNFKIDCQLCHRFMSLDEYDNHYSKCSSVTYLLSVFKKKNMNVTREELEKLDDESFNRLYNKYPPRPARELYKDIYQRMKKRRKNNLDDIYFDGRTTTSVKCVCGAKRSFMKVKDNVLICHICGRAIYRNKRLEFLKNLKKRGIAVNEH